MTLQHKPCCQVDNAYRPCEDEDTGDVTAHTDNVLGIDRIRRMAAIPDPGVYCGPAGEDIDFFADIGTLSSEDRSDLADAIFAMTVDAYAIFPAEAT